ncbi:hypothetical protein, partial [Bradyrhizobium lablabi]|uniref:hypothetical protein n=1 Tax=Bradyrhizobium lablabi TaxID=722472 RepID=UPI0012E3A443
MSLPDLAALKRTSMLQQQINAAAPPAYVARNAGSADALEKQAMLCAAVRALVAAVMAGEATTIGLSMDMVVNEFCVLADLLALAGRRPEAKATFAEAEAAARSLGTPEHQARVAIDQAKFLQRDRAEYAQALALLFRTREELVARREDVAQQISAVVHLGIQLSELFRWLGDHVRAAGELGETKRSAVRLAAHATSQGDAVAGLLREMDLFELQFQAAMLFLDTGHWRWARSALDAALPRYSNLDPALLAAYQAAVPGYTGLDPHFLATYQAYRAKLALGERKPDEALALIDSVRELFDRLPGLAAQRGVLRGLRARALIEAGRAAEAL